MFAESFTLSLLAAVMLKVVLEGVLVVKRRVKARFDAASGAAGKGLAGLLLRVVLADSKFVVLKIEDLLFGDRVHLGGCFAVTGLIVGLMLSREAVRRLLEAGPATTVRGCAGTASSLARVIPRVVRVRSCRYEGVSR